MLRGSRAQGQPCSGAAYQGHSVQILMLCMQTHFTLTVCHTYAHAVILHPHCLSYICMCGHTSPTLFVTHMHVRSHFTHTVCHTCARAITLHSHCLSHMCTCGHTSPTMFATRIRSHVYTCGNTFTHTVTRIHMRAHSMSVDHTCLLQHMDACTAEY